MSICCVPVERSDSQSEVAIYGDIHRETWLSHAKILSVLCISWVNIEKRSLLIGKLRNDYWRMSKLWREWCEHNTLETQRQRTWDHIWWGNWHSWPPGLICHDLELPEGPLSGAFVYIKLTLWAYLSETSLTGLIDVGGKGNPPHMWTILYCSSPHKNVHRMKVIGFCSHGLPLRNSVNFCCWRFQWSYYNQIFWSPIMEWRSMSLQEPSRHSISDWVYWGTEPCRLNNYRVSLVFPVRWAWFGYSAEAWKL